MSYQGDINLGDTLDFQFTTVNTSGVPTQLAEHRCFLHKPQA
jgi:hypothetical protein